MHYWLKPQQPNHSQVLLSPQVVLPPAPTNNAESAPHDFLVLAQLVTIVCAILNVLSLSFGIPAIILSALRLVSQCMYIMFRY